MARFLRGCNFPQFATVNVGANRHIHIRTIEEEQDVKKYLKKPVMAVAASALLLGAATPLLTDANASVETPSYVKVVMNDQGEEVIRYHLKDLAQNDPDVLNMLLKSQADHLYIIVDELDLDTHLQTYMAEKKEEWEQVYNNYYEDIWLEVRFSDAEDAEEIISVKAESEGEKVYVKGIVAPEVTEVKVVKPNGDTITVKPTSEHTFAVSFAVSGSSEQQRITVKAYEQTKLVDTREVKVLVEDHEADDLLIHSQSVLDLKKGELTVRGLVKLDVDEVYVTFDGVEKKAKVKKLWDGVGSFSATLKGVDESSDNKVLLVFYEDGRKLGEEKAEVEVVRDPAGKDEPVFVADDLTGTAVFDAKSNKIQVKGKLKGYDPKSKASLAVTHPTGVKQTVKPNAHGDFTINITLNAKNRSFDGDAVKLALYVDGELELEKEIPVTATKAAKKKDTPNGKAYGYWKNKDKKWENDDRDEDDDDDDDDDKKKGKGKDKNKGKDDD